VGCLRCGAGAGAGAGNRDARHTQGLQSHPHAYPWAAPNHMYLPVTTKSHCT